MTYHIFHVWGWGKNFPSDFIMVIKNSEHIVLGNITFPSGFGKVCGLCEIFWRRRANISEIGCWQRWRGSGIEGCQCTCSTGYTQEQNVDSQTVFIHDLWLRCGERFLFLFCRICLWNTNDSHLLENTLNPIISIDLHFTMRQHWKKKHFHQYNIFSSNLSESFLFKCISFQN